jgi:hypothetical protein
MSETESNSLTEYDMTNQPKVAAMDEYLEGIMNRQGTVHDGELANPKPMPNPTPDMLEHPVFEAIWQAIKSWDVNVPESYGGYCGANGSHAAIIFHAINGTLPDQGLIPSSPDEDPA